VVMSSHVARGTVPLDMPHDDRLAKPFALDDLLETVGRWVAR